MLEKIEELIRPAVDEMELIIYDIEYVKEGNDFFLRIFLDKEDGIDLNTIVDASRKITSIIDEADPIENEYILEVSSPGAEKPLKTKEHLFGAIGDYIRVEFINPKEGMDHVEGFLLEFDNEELLVEYDLKNIKKRISIAYDNVKFVRLAIKF